MQWVVCCSSQPLKEGKGGRAGGTEPAGRCAALFPGSLTIEGKDVPVGWVRQAFPLGGAGRGDVPTMLACLRCAETDWDVSTVLHAPDGALERTNATGPYSRLRA